MSNFQNKPVGRAVFQKWQNCPIGITWYKIEGLFHTLCYYNQIDTVSEEKIDLSSMLQRPRLSSTKISGSLSLATMIKSINNKLQKDFPGVAKS